ATPLATVYVAKVEIPAGTPATSLLAGRAIAASAMPAKLVQPGAVTSPAQLGSLVASEPIHAGEQLTLRSFTQPQALGIVGKIKGSARAVQIPGDANQLLVGTLKDGDRVDLLAGLHPSDSNKLPVTKIVLRNLQVLKAATSPVDGSGSDGFAVT